MEHITLDNPRISWCISELLGVLEKKRQPYFVLVRQHFYYPSRNLPARAKHQYIFHLLLQLRFLNSPFLTLGCKEPTIQSGLFTSGSCQTCYQRAVAV